MIKHKSFAHGWFYHYRVHLPKTENLCNDRFDKLNSYLQELFDSCPDEKFIEGPRSSQLRFPLDVQTISVDNHEVCSLADIGLKSERYRTSHSNVQIHMLENDNKTIGVEVPVWVDSTELVNFKELFKSDKALSGHIDILRVEENKIWIWDFKPDAVSELYASTQVYFYALMLSIRTGLPLKNFMCGYFDENNSYVFKPEKKLLNSLN